MNAFARTGVLFVLATNLYLVSSAWIKSESLWQWKATLLAQEFGHWFAALSVVSVPLAWMFFSGWKRQALALSSLALAIALMIPAIGAARHTHGFRWSRLWLPSRASHPLVKTERKEFAKGLDLIAYQPVTRRDARPCVLIVHGGGWNSGTADEFAAWNEELASHGLVVLAMNYRLAPEHQWPSQRDDVRSAVKWARDHAEELGINPARLIMMGRSAGGQIAAACAYGQPDLNVAGTILFYAPVDMEFARKYAYEEDILNSLKLLRDFLGGDPEQAPENYRTASAINFVSKASPPTLLIHGTNDSLVWVKQSQRMAKRLEEAGVPHRFIEVPLATHACDYFPSSPDGQLTMRAVIDFISALK